jgi:hypothetical protein
VSQKTLYEGGRQLAVCDGFFALEADVSGVVEHKSIQELFFCFSQVNLPDHLSITPGKALCIVHAYNKHLRF